MLANGAPLAAGSSIGDITRVGNIASLVDTGAFAGLTLTGMYIKIFNAAGTSEDWYIITGNDDDEVTFSDTGLSGGVSVSDSTGDYSIGGAGDTQANTTADEDIQDQFDDIANFAADGNNNVDILFSPHHTITSYIIDYSFAPVTTGSTIAAVRVIATNDSYVDVGTKVEITTNVDLANGLLITTEGITHLHWSNFIFDAGGADKANYCINNQVSGSADYWSFENCDFLNAVDVAGVEVGSDFWKFYKCTFEGNGRGFTTGGNDGDGCVFIACKFIDSQTDGAFLDNGGCSVIHCVFDGNGVSGSGSGLIIAGGTSDIIVDHCTFIDNDESGLMLNSGVLATAITNNTSSGNGTYNYTFVSTVNDVNTFRNNHSFNGTTAHASLNGVDITTDADFINLLQGFNVVGDPLLTNYVPSASSPLLDAGLAGDNDTIGALSADAGGAGGGVMPLTGLIN
jgi:hypothetical protein